MKAGEMVGDYEIVRPLGEGGMATVFVARDTRHDREVVLKALPPYLNSPAMEARFRREIQAIASLSHPNIVKVLDFSVSSVLAYYVMPFVPAVDLEKYAAELRGTAMFPPQTAFARLRSIVCDAASALAHCHQRGVYHRDIKPQNILVEIETRRGIMSDFGLARAENLTNLTKSREMLGTLRYMSPEMMLGADVDGPSDVYQLALVTYEIFAGQLPFAAANPYDELKRRHTEPIPSIRTFNSQVAEELSEFVVRSMSAAIEDRPSTMEVFLEGLKSCPLEFRSARGGLSTPRSVSMALSRSQELSASLMQAELARKKRNRTIAMVAGGVGLAVLAGVMLRKDEPRGFHVLPGYQTARAVAAGGPRFQVEVSGERTGMRVFEAQVGQDHGWVAPVNGLTPGQSYTAAWVLENGRRGAPVEFRAKEVSVAELKTGIQGGFLKLGFQTSQPVRARLLAGDEPAGPELDRELATQHAAEMPIAALPEPELRVLLTDGAGDAARLELGPVPVPEGLAAGMHQALDGFNLDALFKEISLVKWRKEDRQKLADHLRTGMLQRVIQAADAFRPVASLYFASPAVPLPKRMATYATAGKLYHIEGLLARESVPLKFELPAVMGPLAPAGTTRLTGSPALAIELVKQTKLKFSATKDLRKLSTAVYDTIDATEKKAPAEVAVDREIRGIRDLKKAELVLTIGAAMRDVYFSVEINGRYRLLFFPPNYAKIGNAMPPVVMHHAFDPRLLEDGPNRFRLGVFVVADFPFAKGSGEVDLLELRAQ